MAEQIISPGVFTRENDLSFLPQGVGAIGAAIVGPTVKGPAFVPTVVKSFSEYERKFGSFSSDTFVPQTVREYLRNAGSVTVTRVLAGGGYTYNPGSYMAVLLGDVIVGVIAPSKALDMKLTGPIISGSPPSPTIANVAPVTIPPSANPKSFGMPANPPISLKPNIPPKPVPPSKALRTAIAAICASIWFKALLAGDVICCPVP